MATPNLKVVAVGEQYCFLLQKLNYSCSAVFNISVFLKTSGSNPRTFVRTKRDVPSGWPGGGHLLGRRCAAQAGHPGPVVPLPREAPRRASHSSLGYVAQHLLQRRVCLRPALLGIQSAAVSRAGSVGRGLGGTPPSKGGQPGGALWATALPSGVDAVDPLESRCQEEGPARRGRGVHTTARGTLTVKLSLKLQEFSPA